MATCMAAECRTTRCASVATFTAELPCLYLHVISAVICLTKVFCPLQGPILAAVYAVKEMQELGTELAFNVAFVFEGEEENGSKVAPT